MTVEEYKEQLNKTLADFQTLEGKLKQAFANNDLVLFVAIHEEGKTPVRHFAHLVESMRDDLALDDLEIKFLVIRCSSTLAQIQPMLDTVTKTMLSIQQTVFNPN